MKLGSGNIGYAMSGTSTAGVFNILLVANMGLFNFSFEGQSLCPVKQFVPWTINNGSGGRVLSDSLQSMLSQFGGW